MKIRAGYEIVYDCPQPTPKILLLRVHPSQQHELSKPDTMQFDPPLDAQEYTDAFGNICTRVMAPAGRFKVRSEFRVETSGEPDFLIPDAPQIPVELLPTDTLVFLLGSRYCDTDLMADTAWSQFKDTPPGVPRVQAICDYVHNRLTFGYSHARATRTAREGHLERRGVCRDFAHLAITLCRCMNIPARYCTGYLGDIGVPPVDEPMDFSAWFEVFLGDRWFTFDARHNKPRIGRIVIARGRDATDVAISTSFGACMLSKFSVVTEEITQPDEGHSPEFCRRKDGQPRVDLLTE